MLVRQLSYTLHNIAQVECAILGVLIMMLVLLYLFLKPNKYGIQVNQVKFQI